MTTTVKCSSCGSVSQTDTYQSINVKNAPDLKDKVKDGSLFLWQCPHCGQTNLIVYQTLYHDPDEKLMIWLLPDGSLAGPEGEALEKNMEAIASQLRNDGGLSDYVLRRVGDVGSLIEKVNIHGCGLDDVAVEMCKYITKMELVSKESDKGRAGAITSAPFKFYRMEGPDNDITLSYPLEGQMQGVRIGFNVYEDCCAILQRNPAARPEAGFARVDAEWLATRMR